MATKDNTFYFSHDYNARSDEKIKKLIRKCGVVGYGVFWALVEDLYNNNNVLDYDCEGIAFDLHVETELVESVISSFDLFVINNDRTKFWSESVNKRLGRRAEIAGKRRQAAQNRWNGSEVAKEDQEEANEPEGVNIPLKDEKPTEGKKKGKDVDFNAIVAMYHAECPSFPRIVKVSEARKSKIRIRLEEMKGDLETLKTVFTKLEASKFCRGDNKNGWKASFDWIFENEKNWVKVYEGNYDNKIGNASAPDNKGVNDIWK